MFPRQSPASLVFMPSDGGGGNRTRARFPRHAPPALFTRHRGLARHIVQGYFLPGAERQDIHQEADIGLWIAARIWDPNRGAAFKTYASLIITRRLNTLVKAALAAKHRPLDQAVRVTPSPGGQVAVTDELADPTADPHRVVVARDTLARLSAAIADLTPLERDALTRMLNGHPHVGGRDKQIDNAVTRARDKLRKVAA